MSVSIMKYKFNSHDYLDVQSLCTVQLVISLSCLFCFFYAAFVWRM